MTPRYTQVKVFQGPDSSARFLPRLDVSGARQGPHLWLTACVHGDEVSGIEVIHRLLHGLTGLPMRGRISAIPVVNVTGLVSGHRQGAWGESDLNRLFPGRRNGSGGERLAHAVFAAITADRPAAAIDLHTDSVASIPYVILDRALRRPAHAALATATRLAGATGLAVVSDYPTRHYRRHALDRSLSGSLLNRARIPSMTIELGPTRVMDTTMINAGLAAVMRVMRQLGMISAAPGLTAPRLSRRPLERVQGPRASSLGVIRYDVQPGERVRKGQVIAQVRDFGGEVVEEIRSPASGWVLSLPERSFATPGVSLATIAAPARA